MTKEKSTILNSLPKPTGPYQVGFKRYYLHDENRKCGSYPQGRLIPIQIYFPIIKGSHCLHSKLLEKTAPKKFPPLVVQVYSQEAEISSMVDGSHSLIIFSHGQDCAMTDYGSITEDLASHGYIVVTIQHHLYTDDMGQEKFSKRHNIDKYSIIIDNIFYVFFWIDKNNDVIFSKKINCNKVALMGFSMGANALLLLASSRSRMFSPRQEETLLFRNKKSTAIKECIIVLDPECALPNPMHYPTLLLLSEEREQYQRRLGTYDNLVKLGYTFYYYKGSTHISFMDRAYFKYTEEPDSEANFFNGSDKELKIFFDKKRTDIRKFLTANCI